MVSLGQIGSAFVRYAHLTFGGGSATIAILHREIVVRRGWVSEEQFNVAFALSRLTPGTNLLAFCAGIGWLLRNTAGAVLALLAASVPCTAIVILVTAAFDKWQSNPLAQNAISGAMAAAIGITAVTCWTIARPHVRRNTWVRVALIGGLAFAVDLLFSVSAVSVLLIAGVFGFVLPSKGA